MEKSLPMILPMMKLADRDEWPCSAGAEKVAERNFGELCAEDLKEKKINFADYVNPADTKKRLHFQKLYWTVTWYVHFFFEFA